MHELLELVKVAGNFGTAGLLILAAAWLAAKWAPQFLAASKAQATALGDLATAVREGQTQQGELLLAVRVLARKIDEQSEAIKVMDAHVRGAEKARGAAA